MSGRRIRKRAFNEAVFVPSEWRSIGRNDDDDCNVYTNGQLNVYEWDDGQWSVMEDMFAEIVWFEPGDSYAEAIDNWIDQKEEGRYSIASRRRNVGMRKRSHELYSDTFEYGFYTADDEFMGGEVHIEDSEYGVWLVEIYGINGDQFEGYGSGDTPSEAARDALVDTGLMLAPNKESDFLDHLEFSMNENGYRYSRRKRAGGGWFPVKSEFDVSYNVFGDERRTYQFEDYRIVFGENMHGVVGDDMWDWEVSRANMPSDVLLQSWDKFDSFEDAYADFEATVFHKNPNVPKSNLWFNDMEGMDILFGRKASFEDGGLL